MFNDDFAVEGVIHRTARGISLTGNNFIAVTDSLLYLPAGARLHKKLIEVHQAMPPFDSLGAFLPKLKPPPKQAVLYNDYLMDVNSSGNMVVAYNGLPYILLFNKEHKLKHIIYLEFPKNDQQDEPKPQAVHFASNNVVSLKSLMNDLILTDNGEVYFTDGKNLYKIKADINKANYHFQKIWTFTIPDSTKKKMKINRISPDAIMVAKDTVYVGRLSHEYVYRFSLN